MIDAGLQAAMNAVDAATTQIGVNATVISTAVSGVADRFAALKAQIGTGMSQADVDAVHAAIDADTAKLTTASTALDGLATSLNAIGADASNPVPTPVPPSPSI